MSKTGTPQPIALAPRHRAFVDAYRANGGNGAAAARTAGFSKATAKQRALEILKRADVRAALAQKPTAKPEPARQAETTTPTTPVAPVMTRDEVLKMWSAIARGKEMDGITPLKLGTRDRLEASRMLAKAIGIFDPGSKGDEGDTDAPDWAPAVVPGAAPKEAVVDAPDDVDLNDALAAELGAKDA